MIIKQLLDRGAKVKVFDPIAQESGKKLLGDSVSFETDLLDSTKGSDVVVLVTEWPEFRTVDLDKVKKNLKQPNMVDGRNVFNPKEMKKLGFNYISVGRY